MDSEKNHGCRFLNIFWNVFGNTNHGKPQINSIQIPLAFHLILVGLVGSKKLDSHDPPIMDLITRNVLSSKTTYDYQATMLAVQSKQKPAAIIDLSVPCLSRVAAVP